MPESWRCQHEICRQALAPPKRRARRRARRRAHAGAHLGLLSARSFLGHFLPISAGITHALSVAMKRTPVASYVVDAKWQIVSVDVEFCRLFRVSRSGVVGRD